MNEMCLYTGFMNGVTSLFVPNLCSEQDNKVSGATKMTEDQYLQWDQTECIRLRSLLVCRLTLFNDRRGGESCQKTLNDWYNAEKGAWIDKQMASAITDPVEKLMLDKFKLTYRAAENNKLIPILIPNDTVRGIKKLIQERKSAGVKPTNPYLFPNTSGSTTFCPGWPCVR